MNDTVGKNQRGTNSGGMDAGVDVTAGYSQAQRTSMSAELGRRTDLHSSQRPQASLGIKIASMRGGFADSSTFKTALEGFSKGLGSYDSDSGEFDLQDYESEAMEGFGGSFLAGGDKRGLAKGMTYDRMERSLGQLAKGDSQAERRMAATMSGVMYYTKQWEQSDNSPHKFLAKITSKQEFNKLNAAERRFLKTGEASSVKGKEAHMTTRLEGLITQSAYDVIKLSGRTPTDAETEQLASQLVKGSETTGGDGYSFNDLTKKLSGGMYTPVRPGSNRGGAGSGMSEQVDSVVSSLGRLQSALDAFQVPGQDFSYSR